jgi:hypothetical protein
MRVYLDPAGVQHATAELQHMTDLAHDAAQAALDLGFHGAPSAVAAQAEATCRMVLNATVAIQRDVGNTVGDLNRRAVLAQNDQGGPLAPGIYPGGDPFAPGGPLDVTNWVSSAFSWIGSKWSNQVVDGEGRSGFQKVWGADDPQSIEGGGETWHQTEFLAGFAGSFNSGFQATKTDGNTTHEWGGNGFEEDSKQANLLNVEGFAGVRIRDSGHTKVAGIDNSYEVEVVPIGVAADAQAGAEWGKDGASAGLSGGIVAGSWISAKGSSSWGPFSASVEGQYIEGAAAQGGIGISLKPHDFGLHWDGKAALGEGGGFSGDVSVDPIELGKDALGLTKKTGELLGKFPSLYGR